MKKILKTESPIGENLYQNLLKLGLNPEIQYIDGSFRIDLAFPKINLAIEADGKKYHSKERDEFRQKKLEERGWKFERFTGRFLYKFSEVAAAKIALKYFDDELTTETRKLAWGSLVRYFTNRRGGNDVELAERLVDRYLSDKQ